MTYALHRLNDLVLRIEVRARADWEQWFLVASDVHLDNPHCDRSLLRAHLDEAMQRGAGIVLLGDTLDLMQGRDDPRRDGGSMKPQYLFDAASRRKTEPQTSAWWTNWWPSYQVFSTGHCLVGNDSSTPDDSRKPVQ